MFHAILLKLHTDTKTSFVKFQRKEIAIRNSWTQFWNCRDNHISCRPAGRYVSLRSFKPRLDRQRVYCDRPHALRHATSIQHYYQQQQQYSVLRTALLYNNDPTHNSALLQPKLSWPGINTRVAHQLTASKTTFASICKQNSRSASVQQATSKLRNLSNCS